MHNIKKGILLNIFLILVSCSKKEQTNNQSEIIKTESANIVLDATKRASQNAAEMFDLGTVSTGKVLKKTFSISNTTGTNLTLNFIDLQNQLLTNTRFSVNMATATPCSSTLKVNKTCSFDVSLNYVIGEEYIPLTTNILANETNPEFGKILLSGTKAQDLSSQIQLANVLSLSKIADSLTIKTGSSATKRFYIGNIGSTILKTPQPIAPANGVISLNSCTNTSSLKLNGTCFFEVTYQFDQTKPLINDQITFSSPDPLVNTANVSISLTVVNQPIVTPITSAVVTTVGSLANLADSSTKMRIYISNNGGSSIDTATMTIPDPFMIDSSSCSSLLKINKTCFVDLKLDPSKTSNMTSVLSAGSISGIPFNIQAGDKNQTQTSCVSGYHVDAGLCIVDVSSVPTLTYTIAHSDWSMYGSSMNSDGTENTNLDAVLNGGLASSQNTQGFFITDTGLKISPQGIACEVDPTSNDFGQIGDMFLKSNNTLIEYVADTRFTVRSANCDTIQGQYFPIYFDGNIALLSDSSQIVISHMMLPSGEIIPLTNSSLVSSVYGGYLSADQSKFSFYSVYNVPPIFYPGGGYFVDTIRKLQVVDLSTNVVQVYDVRDILNSQLINDQNWASINYQGFTLDGDLVINGTSTDINTGMYQNSNIIKINSTGTASIAIDNREQIVTLSSLPVHNQIHYFSCNGETMLSAYDSNLNLVADFGQGYTYGCSSNSFYQNNEGAILMISPTYGSRMLMSNAIYPVTFDSNQYYFISRQNDPFIIVDYSLGKVSKIQSNGLNQVLYQEPGYDIGSNSLWAVISQNKKIIIYDFNSATPGMLALLNWDGTMNDQFIQKQAEGYSFNVGQGVIQISGIIGSNDYSETAIFMGDQSGNMYLASDDLLQQVLIPASFIDEANNAEIRISSYVDTIKGDFFARILNSIYYNW
jgi:hypothetical protein